MDRRRANPSGRAGLVPAALMLIPASATSAQCTPVWSGFGTNNGMVVDGLAATRGIPSISGPSHLGVSGGSSSTGPSVLEDAAALWDGWSWFKLGTGVDGSVEDLEAAPYPGVSLYAGGAFTMPGPHGVGLWTSGAWSSVGEPLIPGFTFTVRWCSGPAPLGPALYAGGQFEFAGGVPARGFARWDGKGWAEAGGGLAPYAAGQVPDVRALCLFDDDGAGPRPPGLYVGGDFKYAGGVWVNSLGRWDGASWEPLGSSTGSYVRALAVFDSDHAGTLGESLFAGGVGIDAAGLPTNGLARWDGTTWHAVPQWIGSSVHALAVFDDDGGGPGRPALYVGGISVRAGTFPNQRLLKWDGAQWFSVGGGVSQANFGSPAVNALDVLDEDGTGPNPGGLYVGGWFNIAGTVNAPGIARWGCPLPPACWANCNRDLHPVTGAPLLSIADFGCFQTRFILSDPSIDCNGDGSLTIADFGCFQGRFIAGCP